MKDNKCEHRYCEGHDVKCRLTGLTLGDIMGYDEKLCNVCQQTFIRELVRKLAKVLVESRPNNNKELLNYMYGKRALTDMAILHDCDFCRNAYTCEELSHDNDLSYMSVGKGDDNTRMLFATGDKRPTLLIVETRTDRGFKPIATLKPKYCPFCGRELIENCKGDKK